MRSSVTTRCYAANGTLHAVNINGGQNTAEESSPNGEGAEGEDRIWVVESA
jgi:hypothetical protein